MMSSVRMPYHFLLGQNQMLRLTILVHMLGRRCNLQCSFSTANKSINCYCSTGPDFFSSFIYIFC